MFEKVTPESVGISSEIVLKFLEKLDEYNFSTHSIIMARGDKIFAEAYYAPFNKDFKHRMYSVSKSFVSIAVGLAEEDGLLSLEDKMIDYFPEYVNEDNIGRLGELTIRDMLKMSTCVDKEKWWFNTGTKDRTAVYFEGSNDRIPGTIYTYDSPGSYMLNVIVEKVTGKPFLEYLKERFLIKAGFSEDSYCLKCPGGYSFGDSGIMCTARDLLVFAKFVMNKGVIDGVRYMNEEYITEACKFQTANDHTGTVPGYNTYGYGYQIWKAPRDGWAFVGMGDQFAICDVKTNFIFIINSDNQGPQGSIATRTHLYHFLYDMIVENLGEALPENPEAFNKLEEYSKNRKLFFLKGEKTSSYMQKISGKTYDLKENKMGIKYIKFDFEGDKGNLTYENAQGEKSIPFGFGYNEFSKFPQKGYSDMIATFEAEGNMYDCVASADWIEEKKLRIKIQIIDKYFGNCNMIFSFKEEEIGVYMQKNAEAFLDEYEGWANGSLRK